MLKLTTGQRATVRQTLTKMEADTGMLFVWLESLRVHAGAEYLSAVQTKLAEALEAMRHLKLVAQESEPAAETLPFEL